MTVGSMRSIGVCLLLCTFVACSRDDPELRRADGSLLSTSGGDVALSDGSHLQFVVTSQRYKQWEAARAGLSRSVAARFGQILQPKSPTQRSIDRAVSYLESTPSAKQAIERSGMSVRDFVLMTVALEQEMQLANGRGATSTDNNSIPQTYPVPADSMPQPAPVLPRPRVDTVRDSAPPRPRVDTAMPPPRRDSVKRDTVAKPPRDTSRDSATTRSR